MSLKKKPAYLARALLSLKKSIEPISEIMPAAYTSPIPGIDLRMVNSLSQRPLMFFSIALSITLRLSSKALIVLKDEEIATLIGS